MAVDCISSGLRLVAPEKIPTVPASRVTHFKSTVSAHSATCLNDSNIQIDIQSFAYGRVINHVHFMCLVLMW